MKEYRKSDLSLNPTEKIVIIISLVLLLFIISYKFFSEIPKEDQTVMIYTVNSVSYSSEDAVARLVNINTADEAALQTVSGIGEAKAKAIIEYRNENGAFTSLDELLNVNGIGEKLLEKIKPYLTVE